MHFAKFNWSKASKTNSSNLQINMIEKPQTYIISTEVALATTRVARQTLIYYSIPKFIFWTLLNKTPIFRPEIKGLNQILKLPHSSDQNPKVIVPLGQASNSLGVAFNVKAFNWLGGCLAGQNQIPPGQTPKQEIGMLGLMIG